MTDQADPPEARSWALVATVTPRGIDLAVQVSGCIACGCAVWDREKHLTVCPPATNRTEDAIATLGLYITPDWDGAPTLWQHDHEHPLEPHRVCAWGDLYGLVAEDDPLADWLWERVSAGVPVRPHRTAEPGGVPPAEGSREGAAGPDHCRTTDDVIRRP